MLINHIGVDVPDTIPIDLHNLKLSRSISFIEAMCKTLVYLKAIFTNFFVLAEFLPPITINKSTFFAIFSVSYSRKTVSLNILLMTSRPVYLLFNISEIFSKMENSFVVCDTRTILESYEKLILSVSS